MRCAIEVAERAKAYGNHPFGAVLVIEGVIVLEAENTVSTSRDCTGHAEVNLMRLAWRDHDADVLADATLYSSCEPCAMCAAAIYEGGVGRLVYGLSAQRLLTLTDFNPNHPTLALPCREVFSRGQRPVQVTGPLLEAEAARAHVGFWTDPGLSARVEEGSAL